MTAPWMPPLPIVDLSRDNLYGYTTDQMRQAQADAARAALEKAALVCYNEGERMFPMSVRSLAVAIRALAEEITP